MNKNLLFSSLCVCLMSFVGLASAQTTVIKRPHSVTVVHGPVHPHHHVVVIRHPRHHHVVIVRHPMHHHVVVRHTTIVHTPGVVHKKIVVHH